MCQTSFQLKRKYVGWEKAQKKEAGRGSESQERNITRSGRKEAFTFWVFFNHNTNQVPYSVSPLQNADNFHQERLYREMDVHTQTLSAFIDAFLWFNPENSDTRDFLELLYRCFFGLLRQYEDRQSPAIGTNVPDTILTGLPGRPRYSIAT